ncbi:MAG: hypothetical protein QUS14_16100 [Pyrinomonadaceae bacterium]|nr:hypothetical protein [Pyrinomonadaceae bacterium]
MKNINKFSVFVIIPVFLCSLIAGCSHLSMSQKRGTPPGKFSSDYLPPERTGSFESNDVRESSGLVVSRCQPGVMWTHNDSGDDAFIFAFNETGRHLGTWSVTNAANMDWEDIATKREADGTCYLYIGDIGNNKAEKGELSVYRVREPELSPESQSTSRKQPARTAAAEIVTFSYPDGRHDAESLLVHPNTGDIYVLTKEVSGAAGVYKLTPVQGQAGKMAATRVGSVSVPAVPNGLLTGADISPDGKRVLLVDYFAGYEMVLEARDANFDDIWTQAVTPIDIGERKNGEAAAYSADGAALFSTSEGKNAPIYRIRRKN